VVINRAGAVAHKGGNGFANLEWREPIRPETVFGLGSVTKPFTAQAIMLLEQQGILRLDDEINRYLSARRADARQADHRRAAAHAHVWYRQFRYAARFLAQYRARAAHCGRGDRALQRPPSRL
jgi:hypothetical protein